MFDDAACVHSHREKCPDRSESPHSGFFQQILWTDDLSEAVITPPSGLDIG